MTDLLNLSQYGKYRFFYPFFAILGEGVFNLWLIGMEVTCEFSQRYFRA